MIVLNSSSGADLPEPARLLSHWSTSDPSRPAVLDGANVVSYGDLHARVTMLADWLREQDVGPGRQLALVLPNSLGFIMWFFAGLEAGAVVATLDPALKPDERERMLRSGKIDFVAMAGNGEDSDHWLVSGVWAAPEPVTLSTRRAPPSKTLLPEGTVLHRFSSGSTGQPKHVLYSAENLREDYRHLCAALPLGEKDVFLGVTPFFHAFGGLGLMAAFAVGAVTIPLQRFMPADVLRTMADCRPTVFFATPPMVEMLGRCHVSEQHSAALNALTTCICATGRLSVRARDLFRQRFGLEPYVLYGSSETLSATLTGGENFIEGCVGRPMPGVEIAIFDDNNATLAPLAPGRVGVRGGTCIDGYGFGGPALNLIDGYLLPGDRGYLDESGRLYILGRDDVINIGGYKVDRYEVEAVIRDLAAVEFVHVTEYDRAGQPALRAIIESTDPALSSALVIDHCRAALAPYKVPGRVDIVGSLPRDANGKVRLADLNAGDPA
ncbi:MAG: hypothetical protein CMK32_01760 [Porticoccaceae bacterium]|nr:hypothetical protein [Porticoccaceae bacterium]